MDSKTIQQIVKQANERLSQLLEEAKLADLAKEKRDVEMRKAQAVIDLFGPNNEDSPNEVTQETAIQTNTVNNLPPIEEKPPLTNQFPYNNTVTWEERIKAYFKFKNKVLTITQIVDEFEKYEPKYTKAKLKGAVTNAVAGMYKGKLLKVYDPGVKMRGFYYGNPLWFEAGLLKEEHKPDLKEKLLW